MQFLEKTRNRTLLDAAMPRSAGRLVRSSLLTSSLILAMSAFNSTVSADVASDLASGISVQEAILKAIEEGKDLVAIQAEFALNGWDVEFVADLALIEEEEGDSLAPDSVLFEAAFIQEQILGRSVGSRGTVVINGIKCGFVGAGSNIMRCVAPEEEFLRAGVRENLQTADALQNARMQQNNASASGSGNQVQVASVSTGSGVQPVANAPAGTGTNTATTTTTAPAATTTTATAPEAGSATAVAGTTATVGSTAPAAAGGDQAQAQAGLSSTAQTTPNVPTPTAAQAIQSAPTVQSSLAGETSQWSYRLWDQNRASGNTLAANDDSSVNSVAVITGGDIQEAVDIVANGGNTSICPDGSRGFGDCGIPSPN